jgi:O-antigen biosynthesis protein
MTTLPLVDPGWRERSDHIRVFMLLPTLNPYGGVVSVVNLANILTDRSHRVVLGSLSRNALDLVHPRSEPLYLDDPTCLSELVTGQFDLLVATSWETVAPVVAAAETTEIPPIYFVQDFEPDFYDDPSICGAARTTYDLIPHRVVKTEYLRRRLIEEGGWESHKMQPGMDLDLFYPRLAADARPSDVVLAMARPGTPADHRGFSVLVEVFEALHRRNPELRFRVFGSDDQSAFSHPVEVLGRVEPKDLPFIYSSSTVFIDTSLQHGFGRTGVEAMACGTACVLSDSGGISEYAQHEGNALVVPVGDVDATVDAVELLLDDRKLRSTLVKAGLSSVRRLSDYDAAADFLHLARTIIDTSKSGTSIA